MWKKKENRTFAIAAPDRELQVIRLVDRDLYDYVFAYPTSRSLRQYVVGDDFYLVEYHDNHPFDVIWSSREDNLEKKPFGYRRSVLPLPFIQEDNTTVNKLYVLDSVPYGEGSYFRIMLERKVVLEPEIEMTNKGLIVAKPEYPMGVLFTNAAGCRLKILTTHKKIEKVQYSVGSSDDDYALVFERKTNDPTSTYEEYEAIVHPRVPSLRSSVQGYYFFEERRFQGSVVGVGFRRKLYNLLHVNRLYGRIQNKGNSVVMRVYASSQKRLRQMQFPVNILLEEGFEFVNYKSYPEIIT